MIERRLLQFAVAIGGLVPVSAGLLGVAFPGMLDMSGVPQTLTHVAYLSGLLLGIGLAFWSAIPSIETKSARVTVLTAIVVLGGLARLVTAVRLGVWTHWVTGPLVMELGVTPLLWFWQQRIARA